MQKDLFKFKFSLLPGDLIYALAGIQHACLKYNRRALIYLGLNIEWQMSEEVRAGRTNLATLTAETMAMFKPLLESQDYIDSIKSWEAECPEQYAEWGSFHKIPRTQDEILRWYKTNLTDVVDLDKQHVIPINLPQGNIARWNFYTYPDLACDLSLPWLQVAPDDSIAHDTIIINRTSRYLNRTISYSFLKRYEKRLLFVGTQEEYDAFRFDHGLNFPRRQVKDFYELASVIAAGSFFIGNQSLCFALAEAMKVPRILEICRELPNVIPTGEKAYDFYFNSTLEYYVNELAQL